MRRFSYAALVFPIVALLLVGCLRFDENNPQDPRNGMGYVANMLFIDRTMYEPTFSPPAGIYLTDQSITLSTATSGASICYSTDGSIPDCGQAAACTTGTLYNAAVGITATVGFSNTITIKSIACLAGGTASSVSSATYTIDKTPPEINVKQGSADLASGTGNYNFSDVQNGSSGSAISFTIENTGGTTLTVSNASLSGTDAGEFTVDTTGMSSAVAGHGSTTFSITFQPTNVANGKTATITITNNDSNEGTYTITIAGNGVSVTKVVTGGNRTCALLSSDNVRCWGGGTWGQLGYGNTNNIGDDAGEMPPASVNLGGNVTKIAAGYAHTCALLDTGAVRCWGHGWNGRLGYGNQNNIGDDAGEMPPADVNVGGTVTQLTAGYAHTCALLDTGAVRCWGRNDTGQLGYGNTNQIGDDEAPGTAGNVNVGGTATKVVAGGVHTCVLLDTGVVRCWGNGTWGQLGYGDDIDIGDNAGEMPPGNVNVGGTVTQLTAGYAHTCALLDTGVVRCWGNGFVGQLGYGNGNDIGDYPGEMPPGNVNVGGTVTQIIAGGDNTCALLDTGAVRCWGSGYYGQLGYGNTNRIGDGAGEMPPANVNVGGTVTQIMTGDDHTCALLDTGAVRCWGEGYYGKLGYGNKNNIGDDEVPASVGTVQIAFFRMIRDWMIAAVDVVKEIFG